MNRAILARVERLTGELHWSYLPPLMVYVAAGIAGLTAIVGTFFVKDHLDLSAEFLAALAFWANLPWALKMPLGHLVDLIWRRKSLLVYLGASLIAASLLIMIGLLSDPTAMAQVMSVQRWYVLATVLAPIGYVTQDVVADAMTVEAVPVADVQGRPYDEATRRSMHATMQTLGRVAIVGGGIGVSLLNVVMLQGVSALSVAQQLEVYVRIHQIALSIPVISVLGVMLATWLRWRRVRQARATGVDAPIEAVRERPAVNPWILGGSLLFAAVSVIVGTSGLPFGQELVFGVSMAIVLFLISRLVRELSPTARSTLLGTAFVIFVFRAVPLPGAGATWWQIDVLGFDQQFLSRLDLVASLLTLAGLLGLRRYLGGHSIYRVVVVLSLVGVLLALPSLGMVHGLHLWTAAHTGGVVDARFIALLNTALESPLAQIAMVPMLAWIANSAPDKLKATFFAVMASFTNLALSASQLGTRYLNQWFTVSREVRGPGGVVVQAADYSHLGGLLLTVIVLMVLMPLASIAIARLLGWRSA